MRRLTTGKAIPLALALLLGLPAAAAAQKLMAGYSGVTAIQLPMCVMKDANFSGLLER